MSGFHRWTGQFVTLLDFTRRWFVVVHRRFGTVSVRVWPFKLGPITFFETSGEATNLRCLRIQKSEDLIPQLIRILSHMNPVSVLHPLRKFHLILSSRLRLGCPSSLFILSFLNKTFYELLLFPIRATWSSQLFLVYLITQIIFKGQYKSWSPALYRRNFFHSPVNSSLISLSIPPYSWTPSTYVNRSMWLNFTLTGNHRQNYGYVYLNLHILR